MVPHKLAEHRFWTVRRPPGLPEQFRIRNWPSATKETRWFRTGVGWDGLLGTGEGWNGLLGEQELRDWSGVGWTETGPLRATVLVLLLVVQAVGELVLRQKWPSNCATAARGGCA